MKQLVVGAKAPGISAVTVAGQSVTLPAQSGWTLLSFLRYASCPACNLRVRELRQRRADLERADVRWFALFHSPDWRLKRHMPPDSWDHVIADPDRTMGAAYGTTQSWVGVGMSTVLPSFYWAFLKTLAFGYWGGAVDRWFHTMPADFLIAPDGTLSMARYGRHIVDHASVDETLAAVRGEAQR